MKQDGNLTPARDLLPSAFFEIEEQPEQIILHGGGFGSRNRNESEWS